MFATAETIRTTYIPPTVHARRQDVSAKEERLDCHAHISKILDALGYRLANRHDSGCKYYVAIIGDGPRTIYRVAAI